MPRVALCTATRPCTRAALSAWQRKRTRPLQERLLSSAAAVKPGQRRVNEGRQLVRHLPVNPARWVHSAVVCRREFRAIQLHNKQDGACRGS